VKDLAVRRRLVSLSRRLVVKVGSGVLTGENGLNTRVIGRLSGEISRIRASGREVVLVSSGAIASGFRNLGFSQRPVSIQEKQACAAVGQAGLIFAWEKALARHDLKVAQVLLTADDLSNRRRYLNARNTMSTLLGWGIIPVVNENDTVVVDEIKFGDNDTLAGMITGLVGADLFINLTDIDGLYDCDPRQNESACFVPLVNAVGPRIEAMASRIPGALGAGGMYTKVLAARRVARRGVACVIANGKKSQVLTRILAGEPEGTLFVPREERLNQKKHWIAFTAKPKGVLVVDDGARTALLERGKSLLPSGLGDVQGSFNRGDVLQVKGADGLVVAVGLTNYTADELHRIRGCRTQEIEGILGYKHSDEVIHRDNMVVGDKLRT